MNGSVDFRYELKLQPEKFGDWSLEVECLKSLNETIDHLFTLLQQSGQESLLEELCPYFGVVWPSARALTEHVIALGETELKGRRVLEVGCGLALPGMLAAKLGANVTATDFHPEVETFLRRNLARNQIVGLTYHRLDWQNDVSSAALGKFDWVIGSDILYERQHPGQVARAMASYCSDRGRIVLVDPARPYLQAFVDEMKRLGFREETLIRSVRDDPPAPKKDVFVVTFEER